MASMINELVFYGYQKTEIYPLALVMSKKSN